MNTYNVGALVAATCAANTLLLSGSDSGGFDGGPPPDFSWLTVFGFLFALIMPFVVHHFLPAAMSNGMKAGAMTITSFVGMGFIFYDIVIKG